MAQGIAKFSKISYEQFKKDLLYFFKIDEKDIQSIYQNIQLPKRATIGSAGYDFYNPIAITLLPKQSILIPTGIRVWMENGWVLKCYPRSGLGFKYRLQLNNTVGIIDSDYYNAQNEGHIMAKITNDSNENKVINLKANDAFMQGIFVQYGITIDDLTNEKRIGGFGSTSQK